MLHSHNIVQGASTKGWGDVPPLTAYRRPRRGGPALPFLLGVACALCAVAALCSAVAR